MLTFLNSRKHKIWKAVRDYDKEAIARLLPKATAEDLNYVPEKEYIFTMPALLLAADKGHIEIVQMLVQSSKVDINQKDKQAGWTALMLATSRGHLPIVEYLVQQGADIHIKDNDGWTALMLSSDYGHLPIVDYLVQQGADMNMQNNYGQTALMWATGRGCLHIVEYLVQQGADIHIKNKDGSTALLLACREDNDGVVRVLLAAGADKSVQNKDGETALSLAKTAEIQKLLVDYDKKQKGNNKDSSTKEPPSPVPAAGSGYMIWEAARDNDKEAIARLLPKATAEELNYEKVIDSKFKMPALLLAAFKVHIEIVQMLVQSSKVDINQKDKQDGYTALMWATRRGHLPIVEYLVQQGADMNIQNNYGYTALMQASSSGHLPIVEYLVQQGADIHIKDKLGYTALMWATRRGHLLIVEYLVQQGADIHIKNNDGSTALLLACREGRDGVVRVLLAAGADKSVQNKEGETALSVAKTAEIQKLLVEYDNKQKGNSKDSSTKEGFQSEAVAHIQSPSAEAISPADPLPPFPVPAAGSDYTAAAFKAEDRAALDSFLQSFPTSGSLQQAMRSVAAHDRTLHLLVSKQKECPSLFWFYPKQPKLRNWLSNPAKCLFQDSLMMVVVCPVTLCTVQCGPDGVGWEVNLPKKWVKQWAPAILFSMYVLQAAALAGRVVGIPLPPVPGAKEVKEALGLTGMLKDSMENLQSTLSDSLSAFCDVTKEALDQTPELQQLCAGLQTGADKVLPADLPMHLVDEAYKSIHTFLTTGENAKLGKLEDQLRGRMERVMAPDGDIEWVSVEGRQAWLEKHLALQSTTTSTTSPTPVVTAKIHTVFTASSASTPVSGWLALRLVERGMLEETAQYCNQQLVVGEGYHTEAAFARDDAITRDYLREVNITARGVVAQLIDLQCELRAQYVNTPTTSTTPSPIPTTTTAEAASFTSDDKASMLQMKKTVDTLTSELSKLRASSAHAQQSSTGGPLRGGKGGLALQQAQCNVSNPRTHQPYTLDELAEEIHRHEMALAQCSNSIADVAAATEERFNALPTPPPSNADQTPKKKVRGKG